MQRVLVYRRLISVCHWTLNASLISGFINIRKHLSIRNEGEQSHQEPRLIGGTTRASSACSETPSGGAAATCTWAQVIKMSRFHHPPTRVPSTVGTPSSTTLGCGKESCPDRTASVPGLPLKRMYADRVPNWRSEAQPCRLHRDKSNPSTAHSKVTFHTDECHTS